MTSRARHFTRNALAGFGSIWLRLRSAMQQAWTQTTENPFAPWDDIDLPPLWVIAVLWFVFGFMVGAPLGVLWALEIIG